MAHLKVYDFHLVRFGESLRIVQEQLDAKNFYICNPEFDKCCGV